MRPLHLQVLTLIFSTTSACGDAAGDTAPDVDLGSTVGPPAPGDPETLDPEVPTSGVLTTTEAPDQTTGDSGETTQVGPKIGFCNDGIVQDDEECDDGYGANHDENACKADCTRARCGDGVVQTVNDEACDNGLFNEAEPAYGKCSRDCALGPHCGDGILQPQEECEPGLGTVGDACRPDCNFVRRVVFLSSLDYQGDLQGLNLVDDRCDELAVMADLTGKYKAWLLLGGMDLYARFWEYDGVGDSIKFVTTDNMALADGFKSLIEEGPQHAVATELETYLYEKWVWTNITPDGLANEGDCDDWNGLTGSALIGNSGFESPTKQADWIAKRAWTSSGVIACANSAHIYCVQVDE